MLGVVAERYRKAYDPPGETLPAEHGTIIEPSRDTVCEQEFKEGTAWHNLE